MGIELSQILTNKSYKLSETNGVEQVGYIQ